MKKGLIFLLGIVSFFGINTVSAEEKTNYVLSEFYNLFDIYLEQYNTYKENIDYLINTWEQSYKNDYPFYYIVYNPNSLDNSGTKNYINLYAISDNNIIFNSDGNYFEVENKSQKFVGIKYEVMGGTYLINEYDNASLIQSIYYDNVLNPILSNQLILSNNNEYNFSIPSYSSESFNISIPEITLENGSMFPTLIDLYDGSYFDENNFTEINLNNYSYVILSLKDYTPRDTFTTTMYIKGQLCPTTLYNYGTEEKKDYVTGWQSPDCGTYNEVYTSYLNYIWEEDITNHAIYYLTTYDKSKENLIRVDSSVYNITYINEENKNNPQVIINDKVYSTIPYDSLTDTSILTQENGVNNTWTCAKYDTDCFMDSSGIDIDNLFSNPLETLKTVWSAIISIFSLIGEFILLLPPTMQAFLYLAFGVGIALGIIKILL